MSPTNPTFSDLGDNSYERKCVSSPGTGGRASKQVPKGICRILRPFDVFLMSLHARYPRSKNILFIRLSLCSKLLDEDSTAIQVI